MINVFIIVTSGRCVDSDEAFTEGLSFADVFGFSSLGLVHKRKF
jgi:hypothetical protein